MTLAQLLVVQEHDSKIDVLGHRRTNLPEFAALAMLDDEQSHLDAQRAVVADDRHAIERVQKRHEDEAAIITTRIDRENLRLYDGSITAHKELKSIQDEVATLGNRRADIEDLVLAAMVQGEPLDTQLAEIDAKLAAIQERRDQATQSLAESQAAIDAEVETERAERLEAAATIEASLLAQYETTRAACGGVGVSRLIDKTCQGCHLTLPAVEYDRVRKEHEDAIVRCGECNRILVR